MRPLIIAAVIAFLGIGAYYIIEDANDGPLENAAEEVDDAIDELD